MSVRTCWQALLIQGSGGGGVLSNGVLVVVLLLVLGGRRFLALDAGTRKSSKQAAGASMVD